jgi:vacuolar-type H+-ATPase subunit H
LQSEIINDILSVEDDANLVVQQAQSKANSILSEAEARAAKMIKDDVKAERDKNQQAFDILLKEHKKQIEAYQMKLESQIEDESTLIDTLSTQLAHKICKESVY